MDPPQLAMRIAVVTAIAIVRSSRRNVFHRNTSDEFGGYRWVRPVPGRCTWGTGVGKHRGFVGRFSAPGAYLEQHRKWCWARCYRELIRIARAFFILRSIMARGDGVWSL